MIGVNHLISNAELQNLDLIDLLSERHSLVRSISEKAWNDQSEIYISNSEWYIMARIYKKQPSISYVTKNVEISRQAIHKFIQKLSERGLVEINNVENNKKEKCIQLTALGEECYEKNEALKAKLENKIAEKIGTEQVSILKGILKLDWKI
ncbi:MarR family winged helix-turn-helix transcriptional regulator [Neobacillus sp. C211]|jgi:DNA-binding MarR family transcriptional regulator|uniref:MarR family winged helix-turn-helix transcriptional regulator n=1 Tax=Bacillaceae TaxID=186817 RepID=UPI001BE54A24|nr:MULTISPECIES: winged helix DNA-binding protein [unclassified Bacillus (in: firmicutes)]MBT2699155.1 winged helix DNA-binding protein [Bacillus sp. ISL-40]MBT2724903.1 winged helix DNA-binding protein [Bacillus sp. ISL-46]MBT2739391.1 winged helix DNA-binding protein [Bacillus sp. ISL-77]